MVKKTYKTYNLKSLVIHTHDAKGYPVEIVFRGGIHVDSTAVFSTGDARLQNVLESGKGFGRDYYIESEREIVEAAPAEEPIEKPSKAKKAEPEMPIADMKDSRRFRNLVEMKNAMAEVGIVLPEDANYLAAKAAAQKAGYDFQIQR